jgi:hypothetical protein
MKVVLITGCSSGIGAALAEEFHRCGLLVYASARNPQSLAGLAEKGIRTLALDVTDEASIASHIDRDRHISQLNAMPAEEFAMRLADAVLRPNPPAVFRAGTASTFLPAMRLLPRAWRDRFLSRRFGITGLVLLLCLLGGRAMAADERAAILNIRQESNIAMLAHSLDGVLANVTEDFVLVGGSSGAHVGKHVVRDYFKKGFADPTMVIYVRTPDNVILAEGNERASERGRWIGIWKGPKGNTLMSGDYSAQWVKREGTWLALAEIYVTLHCSGPVCVQ